jgi:hypothetical protein
MHTGYTRITIRARPDRAQPGTGGEHALGAGAEDGKTTEASLTVAADANSASAAAPSRRRPGRQAPQVVNAAEDDQRILAELFTRPRGRG